MRTIPLSGFSVVFLATAAAAAASLLNGGTPMAAHAQAAPKAKVLNLSPLIGKDFDAYEKVLGRPAKVETVEAFGDEYVHAAETRYYKFPGVLRVILIRGHDGARRPSFVPGESQWKRKPTRLLPYVSYVEVQFDKKTSTDWKGALRRVGIAPSAAKDVVTYADGISVGLNYKGSRIQWAPRTIEETRDHRFSIEVKSNKTGGKPAAFLEAAPRAAVPGDGAQNLP